MLADNRMIAVDIDALRETQFYPSSPTARPAVELYAASSEDRRPRVAKVRARAIETLLEAQVSSSSFPVPALG